jgi:hypothetical protein
MVSPLLDIVLRAMYGDAGIDQLNQAIADRDAASAEATEQQRIRDAAEQARFDAELARDAALGSRADWPEGEPD